MQGLRSEVADLLRDLAIRQQRDAAVLLLSLIGLGYIAYMLAIDVPRYVSRWAADEAAGRSYLSLLQGLHDTAYPHRVSYAWDVWRSELDWMVLYFGIGVWTSIALIHSPLGERRPAHPCYVGFHAKPT